MDSEPEMIDKFIKKCINYVRTAQDTYNSLPSKKEKQIFVERYPFLKYKYKYPHFHELINKFDYTEEERDIIIKHHIKKIVGIYKHAQSGKTEILNNIIILNLKNRTNNICLTKNTLEANNQWEKRLVADIKKDEYLNKFKIKETVYIISSKKPESKHPNNEPTHCKNMDEFIRIITSKENKNAPYVLFICSNDTRVCSDIPKFLHSYTSFEIKLPIDLLVDEAHNDKDGITNRKNIFEYILINPYIRRLIPCTATPSPLHHENSILWRKQNLENFAYDYTINKYKSDSPEYSSLHDANPIYLEDIRKYPNYKNYNFHEFDDALFRKHFTKSPKYLSIMKKDISEEEKRRLIEEQIDYRKKLEFHRFLVNEKNAANDGFNIIDNITGTFDNGISLITTPCRTVLTETLMLHAVNQPYNPLVIGLYGGKIHYMFSNSKKIIQDTFSDQSILNDKIFSIIQICKKKRDVNSVIIIGNPQTTGESITFVHSEYGTLKNEVNLSIGNESQNNQIYSRLNYLTKKFLEKDPGFECPAKYMIGTQSSIQEALYMEKMNDRIIDKEKTDTVVIDDRVCIEEDNKENIAIPIKCEIQDNSLHVDSIKRLFDKPKCNDEDKKILMNLLKICLENGDIVMFDKTKRFTCDFKLKDIRRYRKHTDQENQERKEKMGEKYKEFESDYRFDSYEGSHNLDKPYINNKNAIDVNECELLCCLNKYSYNGCTNPTHTFWISYRY
jgi:hypothetical protein